MFCALAGFAVLAAVAAPAALATPPQIFRVPDQSFTFQTDFCPAPTTVTASFTKWWETVFFWNNGNVRAAYDIYVEQDTFVGPTGKTLVGDPYPSTSQRGFDTSGNLISYTGLGVLEKVRLSDGTYFFSAGWVDYLAHGGAALNPDRGLKGNVAAFCTALGAE
jgi:hypothetical protein